MIIMKRRNNGLVEYISDQGLPLRQIESGMVFPKGAIEKEGQHHYEEVIIETAEPITEEPVAETTEQTEEQTNDNQDIEGLSGEVGEGEEPIQTEPDEIAS